MSLTIASSPTVCHESESLLIGLRCPECGTTYDASQIQTVCNNGSCTSSLFAEYDLDTHLSKDVLIGRPANMWRYRELMPVIAIENIVTMGEGFTPILPLQNPASYSRRDPGLLER
jgi:threonine synthase